MIPQIKKILYTTDLSPNSGYVFRYAINSAKKHNAKLVVLHVLEMLSPTTKALIEPHLDAETLNTITEQKVVFTKDKILKRIRELFEKEMAHDPGCGDILDTIELVEGYPADEILEKADRLDCDVIIMGTHGKGILRHTYLGSMAKQVLRRSRKPVFIIPLPDGETDVTMHDE